MICLHALSSEIVKRKHMFLHKIMPLSNDKISSHNFFRRFSLYILNENVVASGFIPDICKLLCRYSLQYILHTFDNDSRIPSMNGKIHQTDALFC